MAVRIGRVGKTERWRVKVASNGGGGAVWDDIGSRGEAERLAVQLAGGRRDRIRWRDFPAPGKAIAAAVAKAAKAAAKAAAPAAALAAAEGGTVAEVAGAAAEAAADAAKGEAEGMIVDLLDQSARAISAALDLGDWDGDLDRIEAVELARERPRKTVLRAIERRRG